MIKDLILLFASVSCQDTPLPYNDYIRDLYQNPRRSLANAHQIRLDVRGNHDYFCELYTGSEQDYSKAVVDTTSQWTIVTRAGYTPEGSKTLTSLDEKEAVV